MLARRNKNTFIEILLYDSHKVVKNSHAILEIIRKLPSSISFKIVHPKLRQQNHEFVIVDGCGLVYRLDHEVYEVMQISGTLPKLIVYPCNFLEPGSLACTTPISEHYVYKPKLGEN